MIQNSSLLKDVSEIPSLLNMPSKQRHTIKPREGTKAQLTSTLLASILTESDSSVGKQTLDMFSQIIYDLLKQVRESDSPISELDLLISEFSPENHNKPLSASRSTMQVHLPQLTKAQIDERVEEDYCKCISKLKECKAQSPKGIIAIDMSHEASKSKNKNNQHSWVRIGQRMTWEMGFNYSSIYDSTHQLFLGMMHRNEHNPKEKARTYFPWIKDLRKKIALMESQGTEVELIEGDRGYYRTQLFAVSHLGLLKPHDPGGGFVRVVVPRWFHDHKNAKKWEFLMNPKSKQVMKKHMALNFYSPYELIDACKEAGLTRKDSLYQIPVAQVVAIDEYNNKKNRTFKELREEAVKLVEKKKKLRERLQDTETQLLDIQRKNGLEERLPAYKSGSIRKIFKICKEKQLYFKCLRLKNQLKGFKHKKESIVNSMGFFYVSLKPGEDPERYPEMFIKFVKDYHERWGIENGFRDTKQNFKMKSRSQKSTRRQFLFCLGLILYNHWQVTRRLDLLQQERKRVHNIVPWNSRRPHVRKKLEKQVHTKWTAKSYLVQLMGVSLNLCMKTILSKVEKKS